jgi:hypothetical protein
MQAGRGQTGPLRRVRCSPDVPPTRARRALRGALATRSGTVTLPLLCIIAPTWPTFSGRCVRSASQNRALASGSTRTVIGTPARLCTLGVAQPSGSELVPLACAGRALHRHYLGCAAPARSPASRRTRPERPRTGEPVRGRSPSLANARGSVPGDARLSGTGFALWTASVILALHEPSANRTRGPPGRWEAESHCFQETRRRRVLEDGLHRVHDHPPAAERSSYRALRPLSWDAR